VSGRSLDSSVSFLRVLRTGLACQLRKPMVWAQLRPNARRAAARRYVFWPPPSAPHAHSGPRHEARQSGVKGSRVQISPARLEIRLKYKGFEEITEAS
jgi:hypothetical protein